MDAKLQKLLKTAYEKRSARELEAFRIFNGLADGVEGLTIDAFAQHYQIQIFQSVEHYLIDGCVSFLKDLGAKFVCLKSRVSPSGASLQTPEIEILFQDDLMDSKTLVREGLAQIEVDLLDTINPGLFLDMRHFRLAQAALIKTQVAKLSGDVKVLNLFSYTCSFGLHSALAGASYTCNVDISSKILDRGKRNYELSGLDPKEHSFVREDSRKFLDFCTKKSKQFDFIVLDPPTFARHKKKTWSVHKELAGLLESIDQILKPGGYLLLSTNASDIENSDLKVWAKPYRWKCVQEGTQDFDFPTFTKVRESSLSVCWFQKAI